MAGFDEMSTRAHRKVRDDGVVVDVRRPARDMPVDLDGGRVESLQPPTVKLRGGEIVRVDGYVGAAPAIGDVVAVARKGGFVLVLGKVVLV